jgi:glycosyltransferase involved in cell wall biosynthesis
MSYGKSFRQKMEKTGQTIEPMKILMLAPEPFFQPRGTPISVYFRIKALSDLGHEVDLVTYHLGEERSFKNLRIHRTPPLFFIKKIKVGPSFTKVPLDFLLFCRATGLLLARSYDLIFSHEEAAWFGTFLARMRKIPHVYDMHSSLPQQLENFRFSRSLILRKIFTALEGYVLRNSQSIIVICLDLLKKLEREGAAHKGILAENFLDFDYPAYSGMQVQQEREKFAPKGEKIVMYAGNFEPYQGIPLLLKAISELKEMPVVLLLVGGGQAHREDMKRMALEHDIGERVHFIGEVAPSRIPLFLSMTDALVSPRISGTNTPLKIYSYLKSGKPLVATNLWTHTQVLDEKIAVLVEPDPQSLARGLMFALFDEDASRRAQSAKTFADDEFTFANYKKKITQALESALANSKKDV